jgi:two-component system, response regulator
MVVPTPGSDDLLYPPPEDRLVRHTPHLGPTHNLLLTPRPLPCGTLPWGVLHYVLCEAANFLEPLLRLLTWVNSPFRSPRGHPHAWGYTLWQVISYNNYEIPAIFVAVVSKNKAGVARRVRVNAPDTEVTTVAHRDILLVDDDARFAKMTKAFLLIGEGDTNEVLIARDGAEAIEYLFQPGRDASEMPCLVLLDLNMPRLDGFGVLKKMREAERTRFIPLVMLTSSDHPEDVRMAYKLGANSYLDKLSDGVPWPEGVRTVARYWVGMNVTPHSLVS